MALSQRLDLRQSQSLVMTPQLQQAIKLLQFSNAELTEFVERELEKNPLLETDEGEQSYAEEASQDNVSCLLYTSPSPRDRTRSRMPSSA